MAPDRHLPGGRHGSDLGDDDERPREALEFSVRHLSL
jgi:hypothetical protein